MQSSTDQQAAPSTGLSPGLDWRGLDTQQQPPGSHQPHPSTENDPACLVARLHVHQTCCCTAARHVLDVLEPLSEEHGGPLRLQHVAFVEGRGNVIVEYPGTDPSAGVVSFVGAHMVSRAGAGNAGREGGG